MDNLKLIDLLVQNPRASITDLADILGETEETVDRAKKDLEEQKIIPGTAFGESGQGFARISYAYSIEHLQEAMRRIAQFIKDHKGEK